MVFEEILSAVCICLSALIFSISLQGQTKIKILIVQMIASTLYFCSYMFVYEINPKANIGLLTAACEILRLIVFYLIDKNHRYNTLKVNAIASALFCVLLTGLTIWMEPSLFCLLTLVGAILVSLALGSKNLIFIKVAFIIQAAGITTYLFLLNLWINAASQTFVFVFGIVGLIVYIIKDRQEREMFGLTKKKDKKHE